MGYSTETPMESAWRDSRIARIYEGTNEINRLVTIGMLIKKGMKGELDLMQKAEEVANELTEIPSFDVPDFKDLFDEEKYVLNNLKKVFLMLSGAGLKKYGMDLENHQEVLLSISDILIEIYMSESAILRTEKNCKRFGNDNYHAQVAISKLYLFEACEMIISKSRELIFSLSEGSEQKFLLMGLKRFTKYYNYPKPIELKRTIAKIVSEENRYNL